MPPLPKELADLIAYDGKTGTVSSRESRHLEFKQGFSEPDFSDYTKVLASFANTDGGTIMFGVSDKPRKIIGSPDIPDEAKWVDRLRADFDPEISFTIKEYSALSKRLYAIRVEAAAHKPIICKRSRTKQVDKKGQKTDVSVLHEATVYYRYAGQTKAIGYSELHSMLSERESAYLRKMMETLQIMQTVGLDKVGVIDVSAPKSSIYMSRETAKGTNFIDKARLVEENGAPAYVVTGTVDLQHVIHAPLEDEDKNIPSETAKVLLPIVRETYGHRSFATSNVTKLLKHMGIDGDNIHSVYEKKLKRKYITRRGIEALKRFIADHPAEAIGVFGSRLAIQDFKEKIAARVGSQAAFMELVEAESEPVTAEWPDKT